MSIINSLLFWCFVTDLPRVLGMPVHVYLPRGMEAYLECPVDSNPPVTKILWIKDNSPRELNYRASGGRLKKRSNGTLVFKTVQEEDAGMYRCKPANAHGPGSSSPEVQIYVKG